MNKFPVFKSLLVAFGFILTLSCDKDYNEVGANIIGDDNFTFEKDNLTPVFTYNQFDAAVQSNNLPINMLGVYNDADFGTTTASFVTQLELASVNPKIGTDIEIQKVELSVPYFSTLVSTDSEGNSTYVLDSIYGTKSNDVVIGKINLGIFESNKYLETYDQFLSLKKYYSDEASVFESNLGTTKLNDSDTDVSQNSQFVFSASQQTEIAVAETEAGAETTTKVTPRMKLQLNKAFFKEKLFGTAAAGKLVSNSVFKEYFRGIYFKVDAVSGNEALAALNFKNGKITVNYTEKAEGSTAITHKTMVLNMTGNNVNFYNNLYNGAGLPTSVIPTESTTNLYLKGGAGFHSYIDLFKEANADGFSAIKNTDGTYIPEIKRIKDKNWIINEANLIFTSSSATSFADSPNRIYLYDAKNKRPIIDYYTDAFVNSSKPKYSKTTHGGTKYIDAVDGKTKYKIRITNHIKNIISNDSTNVRLGLVITEDITNVSNLSVKTSTSVEEKKYYNKIPQSSVINPLGIKLNKNDIKLEIFYTKPN